ncbi:hypothetical protein FS837_011111 [Tulasnella sp. UAMH 9824]|nr:hypothetical protein FS837_011111 [Tulasnella sp. UAMH 9824]
MQGAPASKKRKAEEDLDVTATSNTRQDLAKLRSRVAATDPATLRQFIVKKFDDAIESLTPRPHSPPLSTTTASASITSRPPASSASASSSTASSSRSHRRVGSISGAVPTSPATSSLGSSLPSTINALSTVFSDLIDRDLPPTGDPPPTPAATAAPSPTIPRSQPQSHPPPSLSRDVHMASVSLPSRFTVPSTPPASVPGTSRTSDTLSKLQQGSRKQEEEEEELHCARCHSDFTRSANRSGSCVIEHNNEECTCTSRQGQVSSTWEYKCCGYRFVPQDPNADTDQGMYCFVGRHTTDEAEAASRKMNAYTCDEAGCWEEGSESD